MSPARLVERFYDEVWNNADAEVARKILSETFRFRGSLGSERLGLEEFIAYMRSVHAALAGYECIIDDLIESNFQVAAKMRFRGVHKGSFFGVAGTGREITWAGAAFFTTDGNQITDLWVLGDIDAIKKQLGAGMMSSFTV